MASWLLMLGATGQLRSHAGRSGLPARCRDNGFIKTLLNGTVTACSKARLRLDGVAALGLIGPLPCCTPNCAAKTQ